MNSGNSASLLFFPPSNGDHRLLWGPTCTSTLRLVTEYITFSGKKKTLVLDLRCVDNVLHNSSASHPSVKKCDLWEVTGRRALWTCFSSWSAQLTIAANAPVLCCVLSRHLGSPLACTAHFCKNVHCISLFFLAEGGTSHHWVTLFSRLSLDAIYGLWGCICSSSETLSLLIVPLCSHLLSFRCFV